MVKFGALAFLLLIITDWAQNEDKFEKNLRLERAPFSRELPNSKARDVNINKRDVSSEEDSWESLTSRYAPDSKNPPNGGQPYVLTSERLKKIRSHFMYWYFDLGGGEDNEGDWQRNVRAQSPQVHENLNFQLPFFGFQFNYTRVSINGYLEFSDPPEYYPDYPLVFPNKNWPKENDPSFIGIFFSKCRKGVLRTEDLDRRKPGVYIRLERDLQTRTDQFGVEARERTKWDVREGIIGADTFEPKHVILVTWKNVSFAGGVQASLTTTNTFQMVLATDEVLTYAIFNYLDLQWTTHTEAFGDTLKGEGGIPAYVGFNAGNGTRSYEYMPYSQYSIIRDLTGQGYGNGFKGRHIFRLDENIISASCNKDLDGANLQLFFAPESGNMLGGTIVNITGPCFERTDIIKCKFGAEAEVLGTVVDRNRAICIQPRLFVEGYVRLEMAIGPQKYKWKGKYFVESPVTATKTIFFENNAIYEKHPPEIKISWANRNLTTNENADIRISLWGYRDTTTTPELLYIGEMAFGLKNTGAYIISPADSRLLDNRNVSDVRFGFLQINLTEPIQIEETNTKITPVIWSRPVPLGWYFGSQWEQQYGKNWAENLCNSWLVNDRYLRHFDRQLSQCPCKLEQALADKGRYLPDHNCSENANPKYQDNNEDVHCVRTASLPLEGSEQQCCYNNNNSLLTSSFIFNHFPWNETNKVPTLSRWYHEMLPKHYCCLWQHEQAIGCATLKLERLSTQDCLAYQAPGIASVLEGPRMITFDNIKYKFNSNGEFVLVRTNTKDSRVDIQGRFEQVPTGIYEEVRTTQLTSVVARDDSSTIVEVRIRRPGAQWRYKLDVFADSKRVYFDRPSLKFQHFPGVTIYTPTHVLDQSEVLVMFDSGAGIKVVENGGYMSLSVYLPQTYSSQTIGLLGNWSANMFNEFGSLDELVIRVFSSENDVEPIHDDSVIKWMVEDYEKPNIGRALFLREFGRVAAYYNKKKDTPK